MGKGKLIIIVSMLLMLSLTGYLIFNVVTKEKKHPEEESPGSVSAMAVSPGAITTEHQNNSGNYTYIPPTLEYDDNNVNKGEDQMGTANETPWTPATEMDLDPKSITVYVNKEYALPKDYKPDTLVIPEISFDIKSYDERKLMRPEAAEAIELLFEAALKDGYTLYGISGYRSFNRQKEIFLNNIVKKGKNHTLKYSAAPGTSEHQTGLAMDVSSKSMRYRLIAGFADCNEGKWLADNAYKFGYIIRYPKDRSEITGYAYEPWHIRYVGRELAQYLYVNDMTLDEYYHYTPSDDFDYEAKYADLINYVPPVTPTPTPTPTPDPALEGEDELEDPDDEEEEDPDGEDDEYPDDEEEDSGEAPVEDDPAGEQPEEEKPDVNDDASGDENPEGTSAEEDSQEGTGLEGESNLDNQPGEDVTPETGAEDDENGSGGMDSNTNSETSDGEDPVNQETDILN